MVHKKVHIKLSDGSQVDKTLSATWGSSNTSVATAQAGVVNGIAPGSTTITAAFQAPSSDPAPEGCQSRCPMAPFLPLASADILPVINSISPTQGPIGATTFGVTFSGRGLNGATLTDSTGGITATVKSSSDTMLVADLAVSANAAAGNHLISASAGGQTSNAVNFFVQVPTSLSIVSGDSTTPEAQCTFTSGGTQYTGCGITRSFTYQVKDQAGNSILAGGLPVWDSFGTVSPNPLNIGGFNTTCTPANTGPCGLTTNANGQFNEQALSVCSVVCRSNGVCTTGGPSVVGQTWHVGTGAITQNISYYCQKVLVNGQ